MKNFAIAIMGVFFCCVQTWAADSPVSVILDEPTQTYTFMEGNQPVLAYHFGEVSFPSGQKIPHFSKGESAYDGAYYTDGSEFGGTRSDYIQPLFGFNGEALTDDFPVDHPHHRGLWWSWCEVRRGSKIGDIWAVNKIRAWPVNVPKVRFDAQGASLEATNLWRYDGDPTDVLRETVTIRAEKTRGVPGSRSRIIDVDVKLEALVDEVAIAGRQKVDYGGYGGMAVRMVPGATDFSIRVVHPSPEPWRGDDIKIAERVIDPAKYGQAAWLSIYGKYPLAGEKEVPANRIATSVTMMESSANRLFPSGFRYYSSRNIMIAFPGFTVLPVPKGTPVVFKSRFRVSEGKTNIDNEWKAWQEYQQTNGVKTPESTLVKKNQYWCYIGTYTHEPNEEMKKLNVERSKGILVAPYNADDGSFGPARTVAESHSPTWLTVSPDGSLLYSVSEGSPENKTASVFAWRMNAATGDLTLLNSAETKGGAPCHVSVHPSGKYLAVANYSGGDFVFYRLAGDGAIKEECDRLKLNGSGTNTRRQKMPHAHGVYFCGDRVYMADLGCNKVYIRRLDTATGKLVPDNAGSELTFQNGAGPRHIAFVSRDGIDRLFVCNELDSTVNVFAVSADSIKSLGSFSTLPEEYRGKVTDNRGAVDGKQFTLYNTTSEVFADDNGHIYVTNRGHNSIAVFQFATKADGIDMKLVQCQPTFGQNPRYAGFAPGNRVIAGNQDSASLFTFAIDPKTGQLSGNKDKATLVPYPVSFSFTKIK